MAVVTVLAWNAGTHPEARIYPQLLAVAKASSSLLSFGAFAFGGGYLILLANGVVDGLIAVFVLLTFFMNPLLWAASIWLPSPLRRRKIGELQALTAMAFGEDPPKKKLPPAPSALESYAIFTRGLVDRAIAGGKDMAAVRAALRESAQAFGERLSRGFRVRSGRQAIRLLELAYKAIGIDLKLDEVGGFTVSRCFFSPRYAPGTCRVIAALDEGLMAGILGQGELEFTERITEGQSRCRGTFRRRQGRLS
jgi:hypothetical protein